MKTIHGKKQKPWKQVIRRNRLNGIFILLVMNIYCKQVLLILITVIASVEKQRLATENQSLLNNMLKVMNES